MYKQRNLARRFGRAHWIGQAWRLVSVLRGRRLLNALKLLSSYYLSRLLGKPIMRGQPISLSIEPTTHCNLRCPHCPSGLRSFTRPTGMLDEHLFRRIIDEVHETLMYLMLYFQGEPYLHPGFTELVRYARKRDIYTAASTNGHYLNPQNAEQTVRAGLDKLIVSIDGLEQETYEKYRVGGVLDTVMEGIDNLIDARARLGSSRPLIEAQFIVFGHNEHEIPRFREMCRQRGIVGSVKTAQLYDRQEWRGFLPSDHGYSRYTYSDGVLSIKNRLLNHCWKMWHSAVVTWDGRVVPCCFDKDADHVMGTLNTQGFREIWDSASYRAFRTSLLNGRKNIGICTNCSEGTRVWL